MSKSLSYKYRGTKGHIVSVANSLSYLGKNFIGKEWSDISHPFQADSGHFTYQELSTGLRIRYDIAKSGKSGFSNRDHFHILNPNATGTSDMYLDKNGNPVKKNSRASHILVKGDS